MNTNRLVKLNKEIAIIFKLIETTAYPKIRSQCIEVNSNGDSKSLQTLKFIHNFIGELIEVDGNQIDMPSENYNSVCFSCKTMKQMQSRSEKFVEENSRALANC